VSIVVSDTSPLRAFAFLDELPLLSEWFGEVLVPPAVAKELNDPRWGDVALDVGLIPFVRVQAPTDAARVGALRRHLHQGESEAIALAIEIRAELLLVDERDARRVAKASGLRTIGVLGLLLRAKSLGRIDAVEPRIRRLREELGFFVSDALVAEVLRNAGE